jgi:sulfatase maturation enzyme AslB (radical SAM superfamily)
MVLMAPLSHPIHLLAKPTGAICNLDCTYCFFLPKEDFYPGSEYKHFFHHIRQPMTMMANLVRQGTLRRRSDAVAVATC